MFGTATTMGLINEFDDRFTTPNGERFLIAESGDEAWPISDQESVEFRNRYRRRMMRARLIRRVSLLVFPVLLVVGWQLQSLPRGFVDIYTALTAISLFVAPLLGFFQHAMTSTFTKNEIERELERRITANHDPAITPSASLLAHTVRKLMFLAGVIFVLIEIAHLIAPRQDHAAHLRVLTGLTVGNEGRLAHFTGTLVFLLFWTTLIGSVLLWLDRRKH